MLDPKEVKNIYDKFVGEELTTPYEYDRWFKSPLLKFGFDMTLDTISNRLFQRVDSPKDIFELGPGGGTWSKRLLAYYPLVSLDMLDISDAMLAESEKAVEKYQDRVTTTQADFLEFKTNKKYDLFFSSRVIEYLNQEIAIVQVEKLLKPSGTAFIITKTPHYKRARFSGKKLGKFHQGQITPKKLKSIVKKNGFGDIEMYPVTIHIPFINILMLDKIMYKIVSKFKLNFVSQFFSESYCIIFTKKQ